ncbi:MAG: aminopeptidase [Bacilli bacterium]|nr:aminopeptidase [Bacilli bacterium]
MNGKIKNLSEAIVYYSLEVKENDKVLITTGSTHTNDLVKSLVKEIVSAKGIPFVRYIDSEVDALLTELTTEERIKILQKQKQFDVDTFDCFINIRYLTNDYVSKNISSEIRRNIGIATEEADDIRINERRWVLLNYPSHLDAYKAKMTNEEFYDYSLDVMNVDYKAMREMVEPLKQLMEKTDKVHLVSPGTNLTFSIKDIPIIPCCGNSNIPDGEIYTAPIKNSVNGTITYNTPSPYQGNVFQNVSLTFENGKIVNATCDGNDEKLNEIFDTDEGARYIGEFALGLNPMILHPMGDILFDEKIIGSIHFTPGRAYRDANNGNTSAIHWDMVLIQRNEYGGGELYFDDVLIRKDGLFVLPELEHLNYDLK